MRMQVHGFVYFRTPCPMVGNAVYYREMSVENAMAIMLSATNGPDELFLEVLDSYIFGKITLEEIEARIDRFEYLGA